MICLLILTGHEGLLESEIRDDESGEFDQLKGTPRALLPSGVKDKKIIDIWWDSVSKRHMFEKGARGRAFFASMHRTLAALLRCQPYTVPDSSQPVVQLCRWLRSLSCYKRKQV